MSGRERVVPAWAWGTSIGAPVLLIGGWTVAAARQPGVFDPVVRTISDLAALTATDRWVMTGALIGVGACHVGTALALRPAAWPGRVTLALGGIATWGVAATPITADGTPMSHTLTAAVAFAALTIWPILAVRHRRATSAVGSGEIEAAIDRPRRRLGRGATSVEPSEAVVTTAGTGELDAVEADDSTRSRPLLTAASGAAATAVLGGLLGWFAYELITTGDAIGLSERASAGAQALVPLVAVASARGAQRTARRSHRG